jgi:hypothetical protein
VEPETIKRLKEARRERLYAAYKAASEDPAYVAEMMELDDEFSVTLADGLDDSDEAF